MQLRRSNTLSFHWLIHFILVTCIIFSFSLCCFGYSLHTMYSSVSVRSKTYRSIVSKLRRSCTHISFSSARLSACHVVNHRDSRHFHGAPLRLNLRKDDIAVETVALEHSEFESDFTASYGDSGDVSFDHLVSSSAFKCHIATYWIEQMKLLERPAAKGLIAKLLPTNPLGYEPSTGAPKKGTLLEHMISWKRQHPEQVILARVGEFYETYGVDALMLINYAGLNPMGGAARAGCPVKNVQATLDSLTQAGLSVAVFEEVSIIDTGRGSAASSKAKLKERVLSQIVSPASSTYIYNNMCLRSDDIEFRENRPAIGILRTVNGYTLCQVHLDTAVLVISERLTEEGVRSLVASSGHIEPVYLQDCSPAELSFLTHTSSSGSSTGNSGGGGGHVFEKLNGYSETDFPDQVLRRLSRRMEIEVDNIRVCNRNQLAAIQPGRQSSQHQQRQQQAAPLMPIYTSTALQIGLIANDNVPDLVPSLLPARSSAFSARFLRKWLLNPPPADIADHMRQLCSVLMGEGTTTSVTSAKSFASAEVAPKCALHSATEEDPGVEMKKHRSAPPAVPLVPRFTPLSIAKVVTLINRNQCNVALFKEIRHNLNALQVMLRSAHAYRDSLHRTTTSTTAAATTALIAPPTATTPGTTSTKTSTSTTINPSAASIYTSATGVGGVGVGDAADCSALVEPLLALTSYESGILADYDQLLQETAVVLEKIDFVIPHQDPASDEHATEGSVSIVDEPFSDPYARIPSEFFIDNEREFRNKLLPTHPDVKVIYETVDKAAKALCEVVNAQFAQGFVVQYDVNNNAIVLRNEYATGSGGGASAGGGRKRDKNIPLPTFDADRYVTFMDRKGVAIKKSYTTEAVSAALRHYIQAAAQAELQVSQVLQQLSKALQGRHLISIVQAAHWAVILESVTLHSVSARQRGWSVPKMTDFPLDKDGTIDSTTAASIDNVVGAAPALSLRGLSPYWMDRGSCTLNPVQLKGLYLLTAPNMSGKSTLMRSVLVAALLANSGLCVPCTSAVVPRYDHYFLRTASYDVPSEAKSAFALEMDDVRVMMRDCTHKSLVMIDELGKGTSAKDGSSLSGALLEHLDRRRISGIFATHLHELFLLPLQLRTVVEKKMGYTVDDAGNVSWNYLLEDGRCVDSMALVTARKYGIDASIVHRATFLAETFDRLCRSGQNKSNVSSNTSGDGGDSGAQQVLRGLHAATKDSKSEDSNTVESDLEDSTASVTTPAAAAAAVSATPPPPGRRYNLNSDVVPLMRVVGADSSAGAAPVIQVIPAAWEVPAALEGTACVYVLQIYSLTKEYLPDLLYVGETESIRQRLKQHRVSYKAKGYSFSAAVLAVRDKSVARRVETTLINNLKVKGFDIENDTDSKHVLFSSASANRK